MLWYKRLYMGNAAEKKRAVILQKLRKDSAPSGVYVITPPSERRNVLDIHPASQVCGKEGKRLEKLYGREPLILGIAQGYDEALALAGSMVDEIYRATGDFDFFTYLNLKEYEDL